MHFSKVDSVSYSKNTLYTGILQFQFLLQNYKTPPTKLPPPPLQYILSPPK